MFQYCVLRPTIFRDKTSEIRVTFDYVVSITYATFGIEAGIILVCIGHVIE